MIIKDRDDFVKGLEDIRSELIEESNVILDSFRYYLPFYGQRLKRIDSKLVKLDAMINFLIISRMY